MHARTCVRRTAVGVVLGVITTLAIAWFAAAQRSAKPTSIVATAYVDPASGTRIRVCEHRWFGIVHAYAVRAAPQEPLTPSERPAWLPADYALDQTFRHTSYGWPLTALVTRDRSTSLPSASGSSPPTVVSLESPRLWVVRVRGRSYWLPYIPDPVGFTASVALWAAVYIIAATAVSRMRRRSRAEQGTAPAPTKV